MPIFDLRDSPVNCKLTEILGGRATEQTHCAISFDTGTLHIVIYAGDHNVQNLIATPNVRNDRYLFEEDCVQVAVAVLGLLGIQEMLANPLGSRKGTSETERWTVTSEIRNNGWRMNIDIPIGHGTDFVGLNIHRFYRGVRGEIYGMDSSLPYPLDPAAFTVVILHGSDDAESMADAYRTGQTAHVRQNLADKLTRGRSRIARARTMHAANMSVTTAEALATRRAAQDISRGERFLSWNEAYFQHALIDLWELTSNDRWLETAADRADRVFAIRNDTLGIPDAMWKEVMPTWYNDTETGAPCTLTSGTILNPITRLIRTIVENPSLNRLHDRASTWIPRCCQTLDLHDREWTELPDGSGMHIEPYPKGPKRVYPRGGSRINPLNREFSLSMPMLNIGKVTGNREYLRKVEMNARFFKNTSELVDGCLLWEYEASRYPAMGEDISHGHCQWLFAEMCNRDHIVITDDDLRAMARTFEERVFKYGSVPCTYIRGFQPELSIAVAAWSSVCRFAPRVLPKIAAILDTDMREQGDAFSDGWSIRCLTSYLKAANP